MASLADLFLEDFDEDATTLAQQGEAELEGELSDAEEITDRTSATLHATTVAKFTFPDAIQEYTAKKNAPRQNLSTLLTQPKWIDYIEETDVRDQPMHKHMALLDRSNQLLQDIDAEILTVYRFIRDTYNRRFPELEALVTAPLDYIGVAKRLMNDVGSAASAELSDLLPNTAVMAVAVAASVTIGTPLPPDVLNEVLAAADEVDTLVTARARVMSYIEESMQALAPNLTFLAGSALAARLVSHAGGLEKLAQMPSQNILLLGGSAFARQTTAVAAGGNTTAILPSAARQSGKGYGVIFQSDIVQSTAPAFRLKAMKVLAGKCGLAVRQDVYGDRKMGDAVGRQLRVKVLEAINHAQLPPPARLQKALPIPEEKPGARRGGKRRRRMKEKYGMTELKKKQNRMSFGIEATEDI